SDEHKFVTTTFVDLVAEMSGSSLYAYREADRGLYDFACLLERDRSRHVVGQTLTHHADGIEKDLNTLLLAQDREVGVYLMSGTARNERRVNEVLERARRQLPDRVALVRLMRYPASLDLDEEADRTVLKNCLQSQVVGDLLLNVLFGRLSDHD